ncbi:MAG: hypothetical protein HOA17_04460 [Candidatus Melainabacteria bacterium]|jgi:hypothetical protein|nr:hypothetical protein [Candidatus Melainabacteria bacterium]
MAKNERIQIPISLEKKLKLEARSEQLGFDSSTDVVRFLINNFLNDRINISIDTEYVEIASPELEKNIREAMEEVKQGQTISLDPSDTDFHNKLIKFAD